MPNPFDADLQGWDAIAYFLGVNPRTAIRFSQEAKPLPVIRWRGRVYAHSDQVRSWVEADTERTVEAA